MYKYACDGNPHTHKTHDWEVQTTFFNYKRCYKTEEKALEIMPQEYKQNIPNHNLHFTMGTMVKFSKTFIVIGLLRTQVDLEMMEKQEELF